MRSSRLIVMNEHREPHFSPLPFLPRLLSLSLFLIFIRSLHFSFSFYYFHLRHKARSLLKRREKRQQAIFASE